MALTILPIAFLAGLILADSRKATLTSVGIWLAAILGLVIAKLAGVDASPWEALVLAVCLAPAILLTRFAAGLRHR